MTEIRTRPLFKLTFELHPALELGPTPAGERRVIPVSGGKFEGERVHGTVEPYGGSDLLLRRKDGAFQQDVRAILRTDDDELILMTYRGVRHGSDSEYYLRTAPFFETSSVKYAWLNTIVAVAIGEKRPGGVNYEVFEIL